jgi:anti-sigma factor RsiW
VNEEALPEKMSGIDCQAYRDLVAADVDGSLGPEEKIRVDEHLGSCIVCTVLRREQAAIRDLLRGRLPHHETPQALRDRVAVALDREPPVPKAVPIPKSVSRTRIAMFGAIAAVLLLALFPLWRAESFDLVGALERDVWAAEAREVSLALRTTSVEDLRAYYRKSGLFDFTETVDDLSHLGLLPVGGTVSKLGKVNTTLTVYEGAPRMVVCRHFKPGALRIPKGGTKVGDSLVFSTNGVTVVLHRTAEVICCMASCMPQEEFLRLLSRGVEETVPASA